MGNQPDKFITTDLFPVGKFTYSTFAHSEMMLLNQVSALIQ